MVADSFNRTWNYRSTKSNDMLMSFVVSVGLQLANATLPTYLVNDIKKNLAMNASNITSSGFVLTEEGFMILAFQPNCKYITVIYFSVT